MSIPTRFTGAEQTLHDTASAATGLKDFGERDAYLPGLIRLLCELDDDGPRFITGGREMIWGALVGTLVSRLFVEKGLGDRPDALGRSVQRPLVVTGIPRTGTTVLHKLLSVDEQFQGLEKWLTVFPMPRPPRDTWAANPMFKTVQDGLEAFFEKEPKMRAAHNIVAEDVDECLEVLKQDFCSNMWGSTWRVPGYDRWWRQQSEQGSYGQLVRVLQLIGADDSRPWLLKNPGHVMQLEALLKAFPDACVVQTHRDPAQTLPSLCSTLLMARGMTEGDAVDQQEIGHREFGNWSNAADAAMAARDRLPARQFMDVRHKDLHADPMAVVHRIYGHFNLTLTSQAEARMRDRINDNPEGRHGEHRYTAQQFGLDPDAIRARFAIYMKRYELT